MLYWDIMLDFDAASYAMLYIRKEYNYGLYDHQPPGPAAFRYPHVPCAIMNNSASSKASGYRDIPTGHMTRKAFAACARSCFCAACVSRCGRFRKSFPIQKELIPYVYWNRPLHSLTRKTQRAVLSARPWRSFSHVYTPISVWNRRWTG